MKLAQFFTNYFTVRAELRRAAEGLTQEQLDCVATSYPATIGGLLVHIADCEYYWIGHVAAGMPGRPDFTRFEAAKTKGEILGLLDEWEGYFTRWLQEQEIEDWDQVFYAVLRRDGSVDKVSKRWTAWHVVEHQARHRGQIFMLMRMQGLEVPDV